MSATRTQVYLSEEQRKEIDALASAEGVTMAEVIRRAIDAFLNTFPDPDAVLAETFGSVPDLHVPSRHEWRQSSRRG